MYFNPRARMGARRKQAVPALHLRHFNPRARMGARQIGAALKLDQNKFQSTRPHGGATRQPRRERKEENISIHAPAWGRDNSYYSYRGCFTYFNPRARMGARPLLPVLPCLQATFQSTRPHGGATLL